MHSPYIYRHTQGGFSEHKTPSLYRTLLTAARLVGGMKMGDIVHRVGIEPIALSPWDRVITHPSLSDVTTIHTLAYLSMQLSP